MFLKVAARNTKEQLGGVVINTEIIYTEWKLKPMAALYPQIKLMRRILRRSDSVKEKRLLEKEIGILAKSASKSSRGFRINFTTSRNSRLTPALGTAIAALDEINDDTVRECVSFIMSQKPLTSADVDCFCSLAKFAVIESAVRNGFSGDYGAKLGALTLLDTEKICRELNPLDRVYSEDILYPKLTNDTKALYRSMTAEIVATRSLLRTDVSESRLSREFIIMASKKNCHVGEVIIAEYRKMFPLMNPYLYVLSLLALSGALSGVICSFTSFNFFLLVFLPAFAIVKPIFDLCVSKSVRKQIPLPQIDLDGIIPSEAKTLCVISTLLTSLDDVTQIIKKLDIARLKNNTPNLHFCALCDLKANKLSAIAPKDAELISAAQKAFKNSGYNALVRKREYSETSRCYQGRERKRGAIESLMKLLRRDEYPDAYDDFAEIIGDRSAFDNIRYVCALDFDTIPLMDSISELVGIAMHPCQRGAGIIAPRITTTLRSSLKTGFSRAMVGNGGCAGASSYDSFSGEFYQDCFGEGIFAGKGLIDVDRFLQTCLNRFKPERILSHDILEGGFCGVAYAGDVEFSDCFPETSNAYFKRQHRWLRGDLQNFGFMFDRRFTALTRFKLFDNVRRAITPLFIFLCFFTFMFRGTSNALLIELTAFAAVIMPFLTGFLPSVIRGRKFSNYRRFYSPIRTQTKQLVIQCLMEVLLLPKSALVSFDALCRTIWRICVTKRKLLDWTTAAAFDRLPQTGKNVLANTSHMAGATLVSIALFMLAGLSVPQEAVVWVMRVSGHNVDVAARHGVSLFAFMMSVLFLSALPVILYCDKTGGETKPRLTQSMKQDLIKSSRKIWQFYEDYTIAEHNFLPPDNVQYTPVYRVAARTSPTNIGMYLLSCVAARLFGFIDKSGFEKRVARTVSTIEKLEKWHGNLCNWYTTDGLEVISSFVSSVDSGNYVCCLVALKEALKHDCCDSDLVSRVEKQIDETDLRPFYNPARNLFSIGYDLHEKKLSHHHYDLLMSEARMLSYYAIASGQAHKRHWRYLGRVMGRKGKYAAPVAWTGTMFEYYMPELLLSSKEGSMEYEALKFCLHCQEQHGKSQYPKPLPFGISESGFYAFDRQLNYQYKAHGVQDVGLKAGLNREYVVSPYSTFLALSYDPIGCYNNLVKLEKLGVCHERYGFYEAVDFTKHRVGSGFAVVKSHMAHHMGMSICAVANTLFDGIMQKLFVTDEKMKRAEELMEEKIIAGEAVLGSPERQEEKEMRMNADVLTTFSSTQPRLNLLSNGRLSVVTSDIGVSQTFYENKAAVVPTFDMFTPRGSLFAFVEGENVFPFYNHPKLPVPKEAENCVVFTQNTSEYLCCTKTLKMGLDVFLAETDPVEIRCFSAQNKSSVKRNLTLAAYLEPALARPCDITAHPAFMDLFVKLSYNAADKLIVAIRKERDSNDETVMAIGFTDTDIDFALSFNREEVIDRNEGIFSCLDKARDRSTTTVDVPAPCIFIKADLSLDAHECRTANMFVCYGNSGAEVVAMAHKMRAKPAPEPSEDIISPLVADTIYGRITRRVLGSILYTPKTNSTAVNANHLDVRELWKYGISCDNPIVLYEPCGGVNAVDAVIEMKKALSLCQIEFDLVMLYETPKQRQLYEELRGEINTEVFVIDKYGIPMCDLTLIQAAAVLTLRSDKILQPVKATRKTAPKLLMLNKSKRVKLNSDSESKYTINETPDVPWSNVIANSRFGTLVSDCALGYTWALNSRECKLTPWVNDIRSDNKGELIVMRTEKNGTTKFYDLIDGSRAVFASNAADWYGIAGSSIEVNTSVRVYERGMGKRISLELTNMGKTARQVEIAYYTEPVIGVTRHCVSSRLIKCDAECNTLIVRNPSNLALSGAMTITADRRARFVTDKTAFWSGEWDCSDCSDYNSEVVAVVVVKVDLPPGRSEKIKFVLAFTQNQADPLSMEKALRRRKTTVTLPVREITSGNAELDLLYKHWIPWQVIGCRMWARTGFYQNSGAYGFRDQLQDCLAAMLIKPSVAKLQILRCCTAQFSEGDVMHWWHELKSTRKGVRTRYSDDLLWLPYVVSEYVAHTGDNDILKIKTKFCTAPVLAPHEHERYSEVERSNDADTVYTHAKLAMEKGYAKSESERRLLLIGGGDWCDGYNRVGVGGAGESVWLSMFYAMTAKMFAKTAMIMGDSGYAVELEKRAAELLKSVDTHAWDGEHYLRAFYDDGTKMGGRECERCKIDLLPQAFAVLAGLPDSERVETAIDSALRELYDPDNRIVKLFTPPFDRNSGSKVDPGYVMSYPVGVRENGGQYTHAAVWLALACYRLGRKSKAHELMNAISPANRAKEYKVEPYYLAADVYSNPKAYGRGGWSLYTGSAGWYYKVLHEMYGEE